MGDASNHKIKSFTQLKAWQEGHKLVIRVYKEVKSFPQSELFGLVNQMQRSAVSITSNVAEGFTRRTRPDKVARDVGYLNSQSFQEMAAQSVSVSKLLNGLIRAVKDK